MRAAAAVIVLLDGDDAQLLDAPAGRRRGVRGDRPDAPLRDA